MIEKKNAPNFDEKNSSVSVNNGKLAAGRLFLLIRYDAWQESNSTGKLKKMNTYDPYEICQIQLEISLIEMLKLSIGTGQYLHGRYLIWE